VTALEREIEKITIRAQRSGLNFFDVQFVICSAETIAALGAYGMPYRFSHWRFGRMYHKLLLQHRYNLSRIHELVINSDPCYAFLLESNTQLENKLAAAHVFAHSDFFKNNIHFSQTDRDMLRVMAENERYIGECELCYGKQRLEDFINAVFSLKGHVDPSGGEEREVTLPERDLLYYILKKSEILEHWQRKIIQLFRKEMMYFWPQMQTKLVNEGWAAFWHTKILREMDLTASEAVEFARVNAEAMASPGRNINLYRLGVELFAAVERTRGVGELFSIRKKENDISFIDKYLSRELIERIGLFLYRKAGRGLEKVVSDPERIKCTLIKRLKNCGFPRIVVDEGDCGKDELYLRHLYDGRQLNRFYLERTLEQIFSLWGKTVHLETVYENRRTVFSFDGRRHFCKNI